MRIFEPRVWSIWDIACVKWSSILFGAIVGAYLSSFVQAYVWVLGAAMVVLAARPLLMFFGNGRTPGGEPRPTAGIWP